MKRTGLCWLWLASAGCIGQADGSGMLDPEAQRVEIAEATELLVQGEPAGDVARAYPALRIGSGPGLGRPIDPELPSDAPGLPEKPQGIGPISTPVPQEPELEPNPLKPVIPGGDPVQPEPELEGPDLPTFTGDPTMDPVEPEPEVEGPAFPEPGDEAISMTCRQQCTTTSRTECTTVVKDPILGTDASVRVCNKVTDTECRNVCDADPPNA
jgi:hypothetical protein